MDTPASAHSAIAMVHACPSCGFSHSFLITDLRPGFPACDFADLATCANCGQPYHVGPPAAPRLRELVLGEYDAPG